jgi:hypothetical protein
MCAFRSGLETGASLVTARAFWGHSLVSDAGQGECTVADNDAPQYASLADTGLGAAVKTQALESVLTETPELVSYRLAELPSYAIAEDFYLESSDAAIRAAILKVIEVESPVSGDVLVKRVSDAWGFARSGSRIRERIMKLVPRTVPKSTESGSVFYFPEQSSATTYEAFRVNPDTTEPLREVDEICSQELANLLEHVIKQHAGVSEEQAIRDACRLLGFRRITERMAWRLEKVLRKMLKSGAVSTVGESLV